MRAFCVFDMRPLYLSYKVEALWLVGVWPLWRFDPVAPSGALERWLPEPVLPEVPLEFLGCGHRDGDQRSFPPP